jgi:predicted metal-dependent phosphoesterase TrpH
MTHAGTQGGGGIELQSHSTVSDGDLAPREVVAHAAANGATVLALTDHDAVDGVLEAEAAARDLGLRFIRAIEVSSAHQDCEDLHVCGYGIDLDSIRPACERAQAERRERTAEIVARLNDHGVSVTVEAAIAEAGEAASVSRPHIARAAGATERMGEFFAEYLVPGAKAFVPRRWPTTEEAVGLIHEAGGVAVLAHPFWDLDDRAQVARLVEGIPFDGVECFYPAHDREQTAFLLELCRSRDLLATGSSDFHGPDHKTFRRWGAYDTYGLGTPDVPA